MVTSYQQIINKVKTWDEAYNWLLKLDISYEEIEKLRVETFVNPDMSKVDNDFILTYENKGYYVKDLKGMTSAEREELNKAENEFSTQYMKDIGMIKQEYSISKVYEEEDYKYVFTKEVSHLIIDGVKHRYYETKQYQFKEADGEWKIVTIKDSQLRFYDGQEELGGPTEEQALKKLGFLYYNNEPVEYVETTETIYD